MRGEADGPHSNPLQFVEVLAHLAGRFEYSLRRAGDRTMSSFLRFKHVNDTRQRTRTGEKNLQHRMMVRFARQHQLLCPTVLSRETLAGNHLPS